MKVGVIGDLHMTSKRPCRRLDEDYLGTLLHKLEQILQITRSCEAIIQTGDFFDSPCVGNFVKSATIKLLKSYRSHPIYLVGGQHDIIGHTVASLPSSPLAVLSAAEVVKILGKEPVEIGDGVFLYGCSFGEEIPDPTTKGVNILVIHRMIGDEPLFPEQDIIDPVDFHQHLPKYKIVLCGDYHFRFIKHTKNGVILNPGAVVRKTVHPRDLKHQPCVCIVDTETLKVDEHILSYQPAEEIFSLSCEEAEDKSSFLQEFIANLRQTHHIENWKELLLKTVQQYPERIQKKLEEIL